MSTTVLKVRYAVKEQLGRELRRCRSAALRTRSVIIINLVNQRGAYETAVVLGVHKTTV